MSRDFADDAFQARVAAFLDDEKAWIEEPEGGAQNVADGYLALDRALAEAGSHKHCPPADHPVAILLQVIGKDEVQTVRTLPPGGPHLACVFRVLNADDSVLQVSILGIDAQHPPVRNPHPPAPPA